MSAKDINPSDMFNVAEFDTTARHFTVDRKYLVNHDQLRAYKAECPHHGFPLLEDAKKVVINAQEKTIKCPLHGLKVSYETGSVHGQEHACMPYRDLYCSGNALLTDQELPYELFLYLPTNVTRYGYHDTFEYNFGWDKFMHVFEDNWHVNIYHETLKGAKFISTETAEWGCTTHWKVDDRDVFYISVYPNLTFEIYPDVVEISRIEKISENKSRHHLTTYFLPSADVYDKVDHRRPSHRVYAEDAHLAERVRRPAFFHPIYEESLKHFYNWFDNYVPRSHPE